jgi:uncharacterized protein YcnI
VTRFKRALAVVATASAMLLLATGVASAHVTVNPRSVAPNGYAELTFRAPNETAKANFTKLVVHLPSANPLASVSTHPTPGWTITSSKAKLPKPIVTDDGTTTEYLATITWTATGGGIPPGSYENFAISAGPMPASGSLTFTADQSYSDGSVVNWDQVAKPGEAEVDHPAPTLTIGAATTDISNDTAADTKTADSSDGLARGLGIAALVLAVIGLGLIGFGLLRRRPQS